MLHLPNSFIHLSRENALKQTAFALTSSLSKIPLQRSKGVIIQVQGLYISTQKRIEGVYKQNFAATGLKAFWLVVVQLAAEPACWPVVH